MLYHYTSIDTLVNLLNSYRVNKEAKTNNNSKDSLTFWASSIYYMNDPSEMKYGDDFLRKSIPALEKWAGLDTRLLDIIGNVIVCGQSDRETQEQLNNHFFNPQKTPFVLSLSHCEDDLTMWKMYGDNCQGLCLEFDDIKISELSSTVYAGDVDYGQKLTDIVLIGLLLNELQKFSEKSENLDKNSLFNEAVVTYSSLLTILSPFVKNKDYSNEQEYRISFLDHNFRGVQFRTRNKGVVPYLPVNIPVKYLKQITLGPCCDEKRIKHALIHLLNASGLSELEDKIKKSDKHYRL